MIKFIKRIIKQSLYKKPIKIDSVVKYELEDLINSCYSVKIKMGDQKLYTEKIWFNFQIQLLYNLLNENPLEFLKWDVIQKSMCPSYPSTFIKNELGDLKKSKYWSNRWKINLNESSVGSPLRYPYFLNSSGNLIHQAYNIYQFEKVSKIMINKFDLIFEFGGGYGATCNLINKLGFSGKYIIYDFHLFSLLQKFYLKLEKNDVSKSSSLSKINTYHKLSDVKNTLNSIHYNDSLFIANWSLTEAPMELRKIFHPLMKRFSNVLISFRDLFGEVNNIDYISEIKDYFKRGIEWSLIENPYQPQNYYLIGFTKGKS